jgi:predicted metalloprotease with PDZ domain
MGIINMKTYWPGAAIALVLLSTGSAALAQDSAPMPPAIAAPQDAPYPGTITLEVDATDNMRGIWTAREVIPVRPGLLTLLYPQWIPGKHAPRGPINLFAGLEVRANGELIPWRRDPVNVYAFHVDVPAGVTEIETRQQYVSPTASNQGRIVSSRDLLNLNWEYLLLYPAGHYARQITFRPSITLPEGWRHAVALDGALTEGATTRYADVSLEHLVDAPLIAGRHFRRIDLNPGAERPVHLNIVADEARYLEATDEQIRLHRNMVQQAYRLYGSQHFDRYEFLFTLSDRVGGVGIEHQRSSENGVPTNYFTDWDSASSERGLLPHEMSHSWNGKFRRPADMWTPGYEVPMRGSLLWVYEGQDQYWTGILATRAGLLSRQEGLDSLAMTAATYQYRVGRQWRSVADTTMDPILSARRPAPWRSWQRNEDYYSDAALVWLDADTLIRERTGNRRSLDDFARAFFGARNGEWEQPYTYTFEDVVAGLNGVYQHDWATFLRDRIEGIGNEPPLDGITRGGYRLVFTEERSDYQRAAEGHNENSDFMYSIGVSLASGGNVSAVQWDGPLFNEGVTIGTQIVAVNDTAYSAEVLRRAITAAKDSQEPIRLLLKNDDTYRTVDLAYHDGLRYPHLERIPGTPDRIGAILSPRSR